MTRARPVPTAAEAKAHPLAGTVRNAALAAGRDGQVRFAGSTYLGYWITADEDEAKTAGRYFRVSATSVEEITR